MRCGLKNRMSISQACATRIVRSSLSILIVTRNWLDMKKNSRLAEQQQKCLLFNYGAFTLTWMVSRRKEGWSYLADRFKPQTRNRWSVWRSVSDRDKVNRVNIYCILLFCDHDSLRVSRYLSLSLFLCALFSYVPILFAFFSFYAFHHWHYHRYFTPWRSINSTRSTYEFFFRLRQNGSKSLSIIIIMNMVNNRLSAFQNVLHLIHTESCSE